MIWSLGQENDEKKVPTPQNGNAYAGQWNDFSNYPDEGISKRHGGGAMIASAVTFPTQFYCIKTGLPLP
jgi:hypothetical protein